MLKKRKIIFRADANALIGMGHYTRLVALAEILKGHFKCVFAMISPSDFVKADLIENGFSLINLTSDEDLFLKLEGFDIVVLDGYGFTESFQIEIKKLVNDKSSKQQLVELNKQIDMYEIIDNIIIILFLLVSSCGVILYFIKQYKAHRKKSKNIVHFIIKFLLEGSVKQQRNYASFI